MITVRALDESDWEIFSVLRLEAVKECPGVFASNFADEKNNTEKEWKKRLEPHGQRVFGLFDNGTLVGFQGIATSKDSKKTGFVWGSYIKPGFRGQGHSSLLYQACIDWGLSHLMWDKIITAHREGNEASRRANQRFNFTFTHRAPRKFGDGTTQDELIYELYLDPLRGRKFAEEEGGAPVTENMDNERIALIEERNRRVELDKAWETSWTRRAAIAVLTYIVIVIMLVLINAENPWLGALVPVLGFLLSTLSLPFIKRLWARFDFSRRKG